MLAEKLIQFADSRGIKVSEQELRGDVQGVSKGGAIQIAPEAGTLTLIHEIAHELMYRRNDRLTTKSAVELEAEAVSYVVGRHSGLEDLSCPNYIALHGADSNAILVRLDRIRMVSAEIIDAIENSVFNLMDI